MNIQKKAPDAKCVPKPGGTQPEELCLNKEILGELQDIIKVLSDRLVSSKHKKKAVLLARLLEGISADEWLTVSQERNLRSWLALPLERDAAMAVSTLTDTLDKLVFQRDHDPLTGLANRRYMDRFLRTEMERASRTNGSMSLIMLDLDHFKNVNDSYGHLCGDKVLQKLGAFLARSARSYDLTARYGGEEFAIILPGISFMRAKAMAERLLFKFSEIEFNCEAFDPFCMTFSGGVAGLTPKTGYKFSPEELIKMADDALYAAKRGGRNRIEISEGAAEAVTDTMVMAEEKQFLFKNPE